MSEPVADLALAGSAPVDLDLGLAEARRMPVAGVEVDPERDRLDVGLRQAGALDRRPALGPRTADAAAERVQLQVIGEPREPRHVDPRAAYHPHGLLSDAGVLDVGVRNVLEPARDRIEARTSGRRTVRETGTDRLREDATDIRPLDEFRERVDRPEGTRLM